MVLAVSPGVACFTHLNPVSSVAGGVDPGRGAERLLSRGPATKKRFRSHFLDGCGLGAKCGNRDRSLLRPGFNAWFFGGRFHACSDGEDAGVGQASFGGDGVEPGLDFLGASDCYKSIAFNRFRGDE